MKVKPRTASDGSDSKKTLPKLSKRKSTNTGISKTDSHSNRSKHVNISNNVKSNLAATDVTE